MPIPSVDKNLPASQTADTSAPETSVRKTRSITSWLYPSLVLISFLLGILSSYLVWGRTAQAGATALESPAATFDASSAPGDRVDFAALMKQVEPSAGYQLKVRYGGLGPKLLAAGVIDYDTLAALYEKAGSPLSAEQVEALKRGSNEPIVIKPQNSYFLLNFFWAVGLANRNTILTQGPIMQQSNGKVENFASTGGWSIAAKPVSGFYASLDLIPLTGEQQARVEEVAAAVYRPCCDNPTLFPDCNHGMAMLGLLELMASQGASVDEMFTAAKYVNAYWFPQQALETAIYLQANQGITFAQADPRLVTGAELSSGSGFAAMHRQLQLAGLLPKDSDQGGSCAN